MATGSGTGASQNTARPPVLDDRGDVGSMVPPWRAALRRGAGGGRRIDPIADMARHSQESEAE